MERTISNREYARAEMEALAQLQQSIKDSGLSYNHIARGTRIERRAVSRAAKGLGVRFSAYVRINYYLNQITTHNEDNQTIQE